jgi:hypothetical protein
MANEPAELVARVVAILDRLGIPYLIGGSLASAAWGTSRTTADADLVVDLPATQIEALARELESEFYVSRGAMLEAVRERRSFNAVHLESPFKIDFFVLGTSAFDREEFARRDLHSLGPSDAPRVMLKTPEDTVLRKLEWFRKGGEVSEHQWKDVLGVLAVCRGRLDEAYLDRWASELEVADLLKKARQEAAS